MKKLKQFLTYAGICVATAGLLIAGLASADVTIPSLFKLSGTNIVTNNVNWTIGASSTPVLRGHFSQVSSGFFIATSTTASSTFANGINLTGGCFAIGGTCLSSSGVSGSGTVSELSYWLSGGTTLGSVATGTVSAGSGISVTAGRSVIGGALTITNDGVTSISGTSPIVNSLSTGAVGLTFDKTVAFNWTGAHLFSGSIEIATGTNPTVNATGEIALDTTNNDLIFATSTNASFPAVLRSIEPIFRFKVASTSQAYASSSVQLPGDIRGFRVISITCNVEGGTSVEVKLTDGGRSLDTETVTCSIGVPATTAINTNATWAALDRVLLEWGTKTGAVDYVNITVNGVWTRT